MKLLSDFCFSKDNSLDHRVCDELISTFNSNPELYERYDNDGRPNFTQLNLTKHQKIHPIIHDYIMGESFKLLDEYRNRLPDETAFWPKTFAFEEFRIKHYKEGGHDQFDMHVDSISISTAKRFLVFFWYLNDVEDGGNTDFPFLGLSFKPKKGSIFMFPPMWLFPHKGCPVIKGEKYLLSSYLHYME